MNTLIKTSHKKAQETQKFNYLFHFNFLSFLRSAAETRLAGRLFVALFLALFVAKNVFAYSGGTGEPNNPYQIANASNLLELGVDELNYGKSFILTNDINLSGYIFNNAVIAWFFTDSNYVTHGTPFTGSFNGNNHKISHLTINADINAWDLGLFGQTMMIYDVYANPFSEIKNLTLENAHISITGSVDYMWSTGGLIGYNGGVPITNCYSNIDIDGQSSCGYYGGLIGYNLGKIENCSSTGNISISATLFRHSTLEIGGLIGWNLDCDINNSHSFFNIDCNIMAISGPYGTEIGGFIGNNWAEGYYTVINNCYSYGTLFVHNLNVIDVAVGGFVGYECAAVDFPTIKKCFSTCSVIVTGYNNNNIGGLVGANVGEINDCFSIGSVNGPVLDSDYYGLGGLVGRNYRFINNCYSIGETNVTSGFYVGGLVGNQDLFANLNHSYFLNTSGPDNGLGEPLTDSQMKHQANFVGWDFIGETVNGTEDIWCIFEGFTYPKLAWYSCEPNNPGGGGPGNGKFPNYDDSGIVNFIDYAIFATAWLTDNPLISLDNDTDVDIYDLKLFCNAWLEEI